MRRVEGRESSLARLIPRGTLARCRAGPPVASMTDHCLVDHFSPSSRRESTREREQERKHIQVIEDQEHYMHLSNYQSFIMIC